VAERQVRRARERESRGNARRNLDAWVDAHLPIAMRARAKACWFRGWRQQLALLLEAFGGRREDGGVASFETQRSRSDVLYLVFGQLRDKLGCKLQDVRVFRTRHLRKLLAHWVASRIEASTINLRLSVLRAFARWIGKAGVVPGVKELASIGFSPEVAARVTYAVKDRSWESVQGSSLGPLSSVALAKGESRRQRPTTADLDSRPAETQADVGAPKEAILRAVEAADRRYGLIFRMQDAFGLRRLEAIMFRPHEDDRGGHLAILAGTKGGRPRRVPVATAEQRALVDECKAAVAKDDSLSGKGTSLKTARRRYKHLAERCGVTKSALGVTGHGLRHGYLHRRYYEELGVEVPVRGGARRMTGRQSREAKRRMAEEMGHSRASILSAYCGRGGREAG
jgi:integrase